MSDFNTQQSQPSFRKIFIVLGLIWLAIFLIAETGYPNLSDNERRIAAYVLDAVHNGHWFVQRDGMNEVASKPPLLTWIAALVTLCWGRLSEFALHFPSALATLGITWLILWSGWKRFGWLAGFLAAFMYLISPMADKQVFTARYDGLFALPVAWAAIAAFDAWTGRRSWTMFWIACAVGTMVKGPLVILLGGIGLLAAVWEWRSGNPLRPRGNHLIGILLFLLICGGWFALAYLQMGKPLVDKMIGRELVGHTFGSTEKSDAGGAFWEPACNVFDYFLPWSFIAIVALWRVVKRPSADLTTRRFERFLFCWFVAGVVMFSISPHQRGRLIFPLLPALALLTGRELARWLANVRPAKIFQVAGALAVLILGFLTVYHHYLLRNAQQIKDTLALRSMADDVRTQVGEQFPLMYADAPFTIEFYLDTYRPWVSNAPAGELLRGDAAAFVVVHDADDFTDTMNSNSTPTKFYSLMAQGVKDHHIVSIISNHPKLEWTPHMAAIIGPMYLRMDNVKLVLARGPDYVFEQSASGGSVTLSNVTDAAERVRVSYTGSEARTIPERILKPGENWKP